MRPLSYVNPVNYISIKATCMKLTTLLVFLCGATALFSACKKDGDNDDKNKTQAQQNLEAGKWQVSASVLTTTYMGRDTTIDNFSDIENCEKDDIIQFMYNGNGVVNEGANICAGNSQTGTFTWALLDNDTRLASVDNNPDTFDVVELNNTQMKLKLTKPNSSGVPVSNTRTYKNIQ